VLGVTIVLAAATLHYLIWSGQIGWPRGVKLWIIMLAGMFIGPGVGLYLITFAIRGMKLAVLVYPTGLFVLHRGRVIAFPWDEVKALQLAGLPDKSKLQVQQPPAVPQTTVWYDLERSRRRIMGTTITITRADGEQLAVMSTLDGFAELGRRIQDETFRRLFPLILAELYRGAVLPFGPLSCDRNQIVFGKKELAWVELESINRVVDQLHLKRKGTKKAWAKCTLSEVPNPHLLLGVSLVAGLTQALGSDSQQPDEN